ncbi:MAG: alpha-hydroxy acid oxidase [Nitrospiraceae bacterium]|nr:alpha-hydroxy acid oxidase [Nitrospiraceae bacterium]
MPQNPFKLRHVPKWNDVSDFLSIRAPRLDYSRARVEACADIWDLRKLARRRTPLAVFDYVDGSAASEITLARQRDLYSRIEFEPRVLVDVANVKTRTTILGVESDWPFVFGPTGFTRMMNHEGEVAVGRVAARHGVHYALSTLGTTSPEELRRAVPGGRKMFQLYIWRDRAFSRELLARVKESGYDALILTVDTPVAGQRLRDVRNGFSIPPRLTVKTLMDMSLHPGWWFNLLTTPPLEFASLSSTGGTVAELIGQVFDPQLTMADVEWLRSEWDGPIVIKGVQSSSDAARVAAAGADAVLLSNHGGRQLDRAPVPLEILPGVLEAVPENVEVFIDGGVMSGGDIVAGLCMGAKAVFVGRAYLYGIMAGGEAGVEQTMKILTKDITTQMVLLGVDDVAKLDRSMVRVRER